MKKMNKKGFTIVELVIVIAVIAILAAVMIPTFGGIIKKANKSAVQQTAASLYKQAVAMDLSDGVQDYKDNGAAITSIENKTVTYTKEAGFSYTDATKKITAQTNDGNTWNFSGEGLN